MDVARCFAEAQERMNIPDETDEEFLTRMAAARRRQISTAKRAYPDADNNASHQVSASPIKKQKTSHEDGSGHDTIFRFDKSTVSDGFTALHQPGAKARANAKRNSHDAGMTSVNPQIKKPRRMHEADPGHFQTSLGSADLAVSHDVVRTDQVPTDASSSRLRPPQKSPGAATNAGPNRGDLATVSGNTADQQLSGGVARVQGSEREMSKTLTRNTRARSNEQVNANSSRLHVEGERGPTSGLDESARTPPSLSDIRGQKQELRNPDLHTTRSVRGTSKTITESTAVRTPKRVADQSNVTTPGNSTEDSPPPILAKISGPSKPSTRKASTKQTAPLKKGKPKKEKPPLLPPPDYVRYLQEKFSSGELKYNRHNFLQGKQIFFCGDDQMYACEGTREKMKILLRHGATLLPEFDESQVTHIISDACKPSFIRACGVKSLEDIRADIPILKWSWILTGMWSKSIPPKFGYYHEHASFRSRVTYNPGMEIQIKEKQAREAANEEKARAKAKEKPWIRGEHDSESEEEYSRISEFTEDKIIQPICVEDRSRANNTDLSGQGVSAPKESKDEDLKVDPLAEFYAQARMELEAEKQLGWNRWGGTDDIMDDNDEELQRKQSSSKEVAPSPPKKAAGFQCDSKGVIEGPCPNQDIIDKLAELQTIHGTTGSKDDGYKVKVYGNVISSIRALPTRIQNYEEARALEFVGDKTAKKIVEIIETGDLVRIAYERTERFVAVEAFMGIYGVGPAIARKWYQNGCRTLEDIKARKGGIKLSKAQQIGLEHYDDINARMPRQEAEDIFNLIKPIALSLDPNLFFEIMGSFRRGKADCGDIDILITRPTDDGKTHAGILHSLLTELHKRGIVTEDLCLPSDWHDLELTYRGLCRKDATSRRRRIDFLTIPYESRGAALLYYTGDDIFNRSMRCKAGTMGFSLNQRGLYHNVIRNPRNHQEKLEKGQILASATEREIFDILAVPWREPHERNKNL